MENVMRSPMYQSYLGIKEDQDKWDDISPAAEQEELALQKKHLEQVKSIDESKLNEQTKISWMLMKQSLENDIADYKWRHHNYPVNQMFGLHSRVASLLINQHGIYFLWDHSVHTHPTSCIADAYRTCWCSLAVVTPF